MMYLLESNRNDLTETVIKTSLGQDADDELRGLK